jgi:hypothetical protein
MSEKVSIFCEQCEKKYTVLADGWKLVKESDSLVWKLGDGVYIFGGGCYFKVLNGLKEK